MCMANKKQQNKSEWKVLKTWELGELSWWVISGIWFWATEKTEKKESKAEKEKVKLAKYIILISLITLIILITYITKITIKSTQKNSTEKTSSTEITTFAEIKYCSPRYNKAFFECSNDYEPICWNDNKTYDNECMGCYIWKIKYYTDWECKN